MFKHGRLSRSCTSSAHTQPHRKSLPLCLLIRPPAGKGATPLMAAAVHGRDDVVSTLLSNGVCVCVCLCSWWSSHARCGMQVCQVAWNEVSVHPAVNLGV